MTSILTNVAAMAALSTLRGISSSMEETQARVSSGLRVGEASDNAAYWSIATTMKSDNMALSAVQDALGLGAAKVDTAYAGMESVIDVVKEIKAKLVAATEDGVDKAKIQGEIKQLTDQLSSVVESASFSGQNWLKGANGTDLTVVSGFVRTNNGTSSSVAVSTITYDMKALVTTDNTGLLDKSYTVADNSVTLSIDFNGTNKDVTVKSYEMDALIKSNAVFEGNYAKVTTAVAGGAAAGDYVKVDGAWVVAKERSTTATDADYGQEVAYKTASDNKVWVVESLLAANQPTATGNTAPMSLLGLGVGVGIVGISNDNLKAMIKGVDAALTDLTSAAAELGSISMRIGLQEDFAAKLSDSIDQGVGRLVDADMNEESTRLKALQTQQQLAIQSLSIANSSSEVILSLFR